MLKTMDNSVPDENSIPDESAEAPRTNVRTVIEPPRGFELLNLRELWQYRELLFSLTRRDIQVRYKQTVLGVAWAVVQPVMQTIVMAVIFGKFAGMHEFVRGPYPVFVLAGLLPWGLFSGGLAGAGMSVLAAGSVITKIYFPRLLVPVSAVGVNVINFCISLVILIAVMLWYGSYPGWQIVLLPVFVALIIWTTLAFGIGLSALMVEYRDFRHISPFIIQTMLYVTPVIYPLEMVWRPYRWVLALNPMTGLVGGFRWCVTGKTFEWYTLGVSIAITMAVFLLSSSYFRRTEARFADIL